MPLDHVSALIVFALVSSITPGPNNLMLLASGANFGFRRTVPHMLGISIGFTLMVALVGVGLAGIFIAVPALRRVLTVVSVMYLLYLAWKIATAAPMGAPSDTARPMTFLGAAAFQWVNPKAWAIALTAVTLYAPTQSFLAVLVVALVFGLVNLPAITVWTLGGGVVRRILSSTPRLRIFNATMALLLVASLLPNLTW